MKFSVQFILGLVAGTVLSQELPTNSRDSRPNVLDNIEDKGFRRPNVQLPESIPNVAETWRSRTETQIDPNGLNLPEVTLENISSDMTKESAIQTARKLPATRNIGLMAKASLIENQRTGRKLWKVDFQNKQEFGNICFDSNSGDLCKFVRIPLKRQNTKNPAFSREDSMAIEDVAWNFLNSNGINFPSVGRAKVKVALVADDGNGQIDYIAHVYWRRQVDVVPCLDNFAIVTIDLGTGSVLGFDRGHDLKLDGNWNDVVSNGPSGTQLYLANPRMHSE